MREEGGEEEGEDEGELDEAEAFFVDAYDDSKRLTYRNVRNRSCPAHILDEMQLRKCE